MKWVFLTMFFEEVLNELLEEKPIYFLDDIFTVIRGIVGMLILSPE